jgi:hypothetical protein
LLRSVEKPMLKYYVPSRCEQNTPKIDRAALIIESQNSETEAILTWQRESGKIMTVIRGLIPDDWGGQGVIGKSFPPGSLRLRDYDA